MRGNKETDAGRREPVFYGACFPPKEESGGTCRFGNALFQHFRKISKKIPYFLYEAEKGL